MSKSVALLNPDAPADTAFRVDARQVAVDGITARFDSVVVNRSQDTIFSDIGKDIASNVLQNPPRGAIVLAYGPTGAGKTFAITGGAKRFADRGLIPRSVSYVFEELASKEKLGQESKKVYISFFEIYKDAVIDLLVDRKNKTQPRYENGRILDMDLTEKLVANESEAYHLLFQGDANRHFERLDLNPETSRGHTSFSIHVVDPRTHEKATISFIDLATKVDVSNQATQKIAKSLDALAQVVQGLASEDIQWGSDALSVVLRPTLLHRDVVLLSLCCLKLDAKQKDEVAHWVSFAANMRTVVSAKNSALNNHLQLRKSRSADGVRAPRSVFSKSLPPAPQPLVSQARDRAATMVTPPRVETNGSVATAVASAMSSHAPSEGMRLPPRPEVDATPPVPPNWEGASPTVEKPQRATGSSSQLVTPQPRQPRVTAPPPALGSPMGSPIPRLPLNGMSSPMFQRRVASPVPNGRPPTQNVYQTNMTSLPSAPTITVPRRASNSAAVSPTRVEYARSSDRSPIRTVNSVPVPPSRSSVPPNAYSGVHAPGAQRAYSPIPGPNTRPPVADSGQIRQPGANPSNVYANPAREANGRHQESAQQATTAAASGMAPGAYARRGDPPQSTTPAAASGMPPGAFVRQGGRTMDVSPTRMRNTASSPSPMRDGRAGLSWGIRPCRLRSPSPLGLPASAVTSPLGRALSPMNRSRSGSPMNDPRMNSRISPMRNAYARDNSPVPRPFAYDQSSPVPRPVPRVVYR